MANTSEPLLPTLAGDIWTESTLEDTIVIPTNVGWKFSDGKNPMGKGLAAQAARRFRFLPKLYGDFCRRYKSETPILPVRVPRWCQRLLLVPTKELNVKKPYLSWMTQTSTEALILRLQQMQVFAQTFTENNTKIPHYAPNRRILVPALGCGYGGLSLKLVETLLTTYLTHPSFTYVKYTEEIKND